MEFTSGASSIDTQQRQKRSRVVLSCGPCRASKLKCDRESPCGQCRKKEREDLCQYAPKPEKKKRPERRNRNMAERLKRLEGMVRGMMDEEQAQSQAQPQSQSVHGAIRTPKSSSDTPQVAGQLAGGHDAGTYVGATHCMAMLEDIEDLKCYFDDDIEEAEDDDWQGDDVGSPDLLLSRRAPMSKDELLAELPDRSVADRLITRYFASMSPSQHVVHRPTFTREYAAFWVAPENANYHWLSQLFMMLCMGVHYNSYQAPHELEGDSPLPPKDRMRHWKTCAAWCLVRGKFTQPTMITLRAFLLYVESDFIHSRAAQMDCYVLSGVLIRLMFKMGLHRDPGKLASISPYEGEMRRRMWNMAIQVESLVSFHMGLPSMFHSVESDTEVPRNLRDEDFDEDSVELPAPRPDSDWTSITYPTNKTKIIRVFAKIAAQSHSLTSPTFDDVQRLDKEMEQVWTNVPSFMKVRPLSECVGDPSTLLIQRFGLSALHSKCLCVLHRRYLAEPIPQPQHDLSRQKCLESAINLLRNQAIIWEASKPGHRLADQGWFITSLAVHDYLLAAMVLYLIIQNEHYDNPTSEHSWTSRQQPAPSREELRDMIRNSYEIWSLVSENATELKKTADTLAVMLARLGTPVDQLEEDGEEEGPESTISPVAQTVDSGHFSMSNSSSAPHVPATDFGAASDALSFSNFNGFVNDANSHAMPPPVTTDAMNNMTAPAFSGGMDMGSLDLDSSWMIPGANMDWRYLDISMAHSHTAGANANGPGIVWTERPSLDQMDMSMPNFWGSALDEQNGHMPPHQ